VRPNCSREREAPLILVTRPVGLFSIQLG
jgi:hypothetical protein